MNIKRHVQLYLATNPLEVDMTSPNLLCPDCNGGLSEEKSLSITQRPDGVLYNCYRATCSLGGGFIPMSIGLAPKSNKKIFKPKLYTEPLRRLNARDKRWFSQRFEITTRELANADVKYNPERDTYVFPISDYQGREVGVVDRAYWGRKPKSIIYWFNDCVKVHFNWLLATTDAALWDSSAILLVEDQLSGIKASRYMNTIVLLGTNFNFEIATHIRNFTSHIVMALDADATSKAIRYKQKFGIMFGNFDVISLSKDIKDMTNDEIGDLLGEYVI